MQFDLSASHCLVMQITCLAMFENVGQSIARLRRAISYEGIFKRTNIFSVRLKMHFDLPGAQDTALLSRTIVFFLNEYPKMMLKVLQGSDEQFHMRKYSKVQICLQVD